MKIGVIGDTHFPFSDDKKIETAIDIIHKEKCDAVVQIGDLYDYVSFSNYPKNPSKIHYSPEQETIEGRRKASSMWYQLHKKLPKARLYQLPGNHDARIVKRLTEKSPETAFIGEEWLKQQLTFDHVELVSDEFILDDIMFLHGYRPKGQHAKWNQMNTITGHIHQANIAYMQNVNGVYWEMNVGWLGDKNAYPFTYRWQKKIDDTHQGVGIVTDGNPKFIII